LPYADAFDKLTYKIVQYVSTCVSIMQFSIYSVNFLIIFRTIAKRFCKFTAGYYNLGHHVEEPCVERISLTMTKKPRVW